MYILCHGLCSPGGARDQGHSLAAARAPGHPGSAPRALRGGTGGRGVGFHVKFMGKVIKNHGKIMENHGKMLGNVWKIPELVGFLRENHGKSQSIHG